MTYDYAVTEVIRVVDGDTVDLRVDLGFHMSAALRFRIMDLNTPERGQDGWHEATEITKTWLRNDVAPLRVKTAKADSFGRWLGDIYDEHGAHLARDVISEMDARGIDCRWRG